LIPKQIFRSCKFEDLCQLNKLLLFCYGGEGFEEENVHQKPVQNRRQQLGSVGNWQTCCF
jgi:hypothetical protein